MGGEQELVAVGAMCSHYGAARGVDPAPPAVVLFRPRHRVRAERAGDRHRLRRPTEGDVLRRGRSLVRGTANRRTRREHGDGARHRALLDVRASHAPLLRARAHRVHPEWEDRRTVEAAANRGDLRPPTAGAGAAHRASRSGDRGRAAATGRRRGDPGRAPVHDDARRGEAELEDDHERAARPVSRVADDEGRVSAAGEMQRIIVV